MESGFRNLLRNDSVVKKNGTDRNTNFISHMFFILHMICDYAHDKNYVTNFSVLSYVKIVFGNCAKILN